MLFENEKNSPQIYADYVALINADRQSVGWALPTAIRPQIGGQCPPYRDISA